MGTKLPPYTSPSEAIWFIKNNYLNGDEHFFGTFSWREVAEQVSEYSSRPTSKAVMWNVAHKKYKCPPYVAAALRKMGLLRSTKRWRFFFELPNEEEYIAFRKHVLAGAEFSEWVREMIRQSDAI